MDNKELFFHPDKASGLTQEQVRYRMEHGQSNGTEEIKTKSIPRIMGENVFTLFNILNVILAAVVMWTGSYKNMLFMIVVVCNTGIGTIQEIRAKRAIDRLSLVAQRGVAVIRDGKQQAIPTNQIVLEDIMVLTPGSQVCADAVVISGRCEVNEGLVTGEADSILKEPGDNLLSGSFLVSGECKAQVERVGAENYAARISMEAKYYKKPQSQMMDAIRKIIKMVSIVIVPVGGLLFYNQFFALEQGLYEAALRTVAALVGMIPEGLVLLTSMTLAVGVVRLAKKRTLVQELYCIEQLARADVLCLDKTGTITEGNMEVVDVVPLQKEREGLIDGALCALVGVFNAKNPTMSAISQSYPATYHWKAERVMPFSPERKWSGALFAGQGAFIIGAPEVILQKKFSHIQEQASVVAREGKRVLLLATAGKEAAEGCLLGVTPLAFVLLRDKIRKNAPDTLRYFMRQGVALKIISGDNPATVSAIALAAGIKKADSWIDVQSLTDEELADAAQEYTVFGRVSPQQKRTLVRALKIKGHSVAMTGDGVNDVLALKEADCSIAMASGSEASRNVADLVLLDSDFSAMPYIVAEGRRCINNIGRSAALFLVKTVFATILGIWFVFLNLPYVFVPIQLTLISGVTIGIPAFFLALEPNNERVRGNFLYTVIRRALPGGLTIVCSVLLIEFIGWILEVSPDEISTIAVLITTVIGFLVLNEVSSPLTRMRRILIGGLGLIFLAAVFIFPDLFSLVSLDGRGLGVLAGILTLCFPIFIGWSRLCQEVLDKKEKRKSNIVS